MRFARFAWLTVLAASTAITVSSPALAQDKATLKKEAASEAAALRKMGEPKDRCSIAASLGDGAIVSQVDQTSSLFVGDRLESLNGVNVSGLSAKEVVDVLQTFGATAKLDGSLTRNGVLQNIELQCINSRPYYESVLTALDAAASGKFDECVTILNQVPRSTTSLSIFKTECAIQSKNAKKYNIGQMSFDTVQLMIAEAHWFPSYRPTVLERLRTIEGYIKSTLGTVKYQELVDLSRKWPGGENAYENSKPDWEKFRRNSEIAIKAKLVDPDSARIQWPRGFLFGYWKPFLSKRVEGYWTCGNVNARNRMGGFAGNTFFVVVADSSGSVIFSDLGTEEEYDMVTTQCTNSLKLLPEAPSELTDSTAMAISSSTTSVADELQKLLALRDSGAITQLEYEAAKKKILGL